MLGRKAAKRIRQFAERLANEDGQDEKGKGKKRQGPAPGRLRHAAAIDDLRSLLPERIHPLVDTRDRPLSGARGLRYTRATSNMSRICRPDRS